MKMISQRRAHHDNAHPADALQLDEMATRGELHAGVCWVHHLHFADEASARVTRRRVLAAGWAQDWLAARPAPHPGWVLRVVREVVLSQDEVNEARDFFETVCGSVGGSYAGWEVRRRPSHALN